MLERISRQERLDLFIAWGAISLAFAIIFIRNAGRVDPVIALLFIGVSLVTVGIGFVAHEMAHKFTAMRYGYWAEFKKDNTMLLVAVALAALVGVVFAAPGATVIYANSMYGRGITRGENGKISAAGPVTNLLLCIPFAALLLYGGISSSFTGNLAALVGMMGFQVNAMIAAFNMLPVSVLDGRKVLAWNKGVFAVLIIAAFGLLLLSFYPHPL
ncbi:MAG: peptidase M50 [Methanoregula sp.]|jgi:Zn-dependent protease|nr:peptidase M50 [Methanoregula sp.]